MVTSPPPRSRAAGALIALFVITGAIVGTTQGQPTIGTLAGFGLGLIIAIGLWLFDRGRAQR
jgi:phage tail tape-measure protein